MDKISVESNRFVDEYDRERIFYGINFGSKNAPLSEWYKEKKCPALTADNIAYLKAHGINIIRHFINWSYLEPSPDNYNEEALAEIQEFLDTCLSNDVYVFLDMHQDLFSSFRNPEEIKRPEKNGDGAPKWACLTNGIRYTSPVFVWAEGYFINKAVHNSFDNFWNNTDINGKGLQDRFCDLWRMLAKRFGSHPALIGFDIFNEPFPGTDGGKVFTTIVKSAIKTTVKDDRINKKKLISALFDKTPMPKLLEQYDSKIMKEITAPCRDLIEKFDREKYSPFINKVTAAIREETENGIIFLENSYYSNLGIPFCASAVTVNNKREKNQAFAPHAYDFMVDTPLYKYANNERVGAIFNQRKAEQSTLNMPVLVGEWGGGAMSYDWLHHGEYLLNLFDSNKWSHTYWLFDPQILNTPIIDMLCRPHPVAVCGTIESYHFDKKSQTFTLSFKQDKSYSVPTEIFCHMPPKEITATGTYELEQLNRYCRIIKLITKEGSNTITVKF